MVEEFERKLSLIVEDGRGFSPEMEGGSGCSLPLADNNCWTLAYNTTSNVNR